MNEATEYLLADADATAALGRHLATLLPDAGIACALSGPLGTGKSSLARALLQGLGVTGAIPSPTYTLVEPYTVHGREVYHVDLYRLGEAGCWVWRNWPQGRCCSSNGPSTIPPIACTSI